MKSAFILSYIDLVIYHKPADGMLVWEGFLTLPRGASKNVANGRPRKALWLACRSWAVLMWILTSHTFVLFHWKRSERFLNKSINSPADSGNYVHKEADHTNLLNWVYILLSAVRGLGGKAVFRHKRQRWEFLSSELKALRCSKSLPALSGRTDRAQL